MGPLHLLQRPLKVWESLNLYAKGLMGEVDPEEEFEGKKRNHAGHLKGSSRHWVQQEWSCFESRRW